MESDMTKVIYLSPEEWVRHKIETNERDGWKLAALYDNDILKLSEAAFNEPVTFEGNRRAKEFRYAMDLIKQKRLRDTWAAQDVSRKPE